MYSVIVDDKEQYWSQIWSFNIKEVPNFEGKMRNERWSI